jgi:gluconolactonase
MGKVLHPAPELEELIDSMAQWRLLGSGFSFTEGPVWNPRDGGFLVFSDIPGDARWRWSEQGGMSLLARPTGHANGLAYEADGSLLVCEHDTSSLVRMRPDGRRETIASHYQGAALNSPNDVIARSDGSIFFTDPDYGREGRPCELDFHGVYRVPPGGGDPLLIVAEDEFNQPNGLCFSPDEGTLYIDDRTCLKAFDVASDGSLSSARVLQDDMHSDEVPGTGNPDGMKCDERGTIWCTARDGVWVISPAGALLGILVTPEPPGNLAWGGADGRELFVMTTSTVHSIRTRVAPAASPR